MADVVEIHGGNDFEDDTEGDREWPLMMCIFYLFVILTSPFHDCNLLYSWIIIYYTFIVKKMDCFDFNGVVKSIQTKGKPLC